MIPLDDRLPAAPLVRAMQAYMERRAMHAEDMAARLGYKTGDSVALWLRGRPQTLPWATVDLVLCRIGLNWFDVYSVETVGEEMALRAARLLAGEVEAVA